jgi:hypothetical protein
MPILNQTDERTVQQNIIPDRGRADPTFGETYGAALGLAWDEETMLSKDWNREGWERRKADVEALISSGDITRDKYVAPNGKFDYNRLALDRDNVDVKSDAILNQEMSEMLSKRRAYSEDTTSRGNGMAQFLGMANAYMLDPISIGTMPIALPAATAKALSVTARALVGARNAAAINVATEIGIQPLVYNYKQDIDSPYSAQDAMKVIAGAAIGGGVIGGVMGGVSGALRKINIGVNDQLMYKTPEQEMALDMINRMRDTVDYGRSIRDTRDPLLKGYNDFLHGGHKTIEKAAAASKKELTKTISEMKAEGKNTEFFEELLYDLDMAKKGGDLDGFYKSAREADIESDIEYMGNLETRKREYAQPSVKSSNFEPTIDQTKPQAPISKTTPTERFMLEEQGLTKSFDNDMAEFHALEKPTFVNEEGRFLDAQEHINLLDKELDGLEAVKVCALG